MFKTQFTTKLRQLAKQASCAGASLLVCTSLTSPLSADEWDKQIDASTESLAGELCNAIPKSSEMGERDTNTFLTRLKAAGLGLSPQAIAFRKLDKDGNGKLTEAEVPEELAKDADVSKGINEEEYTKLLASQATSGRGGRRGRGFSATADIELVQAMDGNRDGKMTEEEIKSAVREALVAAFESKKSLDIDGNGNISKREYAISMPKKFGEVDEYGLDGHARGHFQRDDSNGDGVLGIEEVSTPILSRMARRIRAIQLASRVVAADKDSDNLITKEELAAIVKEKASNAEELWSSLQTSEGEVTTYALFNKLSSMNNETSDKLDAELK